MSFDPEVLNDVVCEVLELSADELKPGLSMDGCERWDSLGHLNLVLALEEAFGVRFRTDEVPSMGDLASVEKVLHQAFARRAGGASETAKPALEPGVRPRPARRVVEPSSPAQVASVAEQVGFASLASDEKIARYRERGAQIGRGVVLEPGSRIVAVELRIADDVRVGRDTVIRARSLDLGEGCRLGAHGSWLADTIHVGAGSVVGDRVIVDVAGRGLTSRSVLDIGRLCSVTSEVVLNLANPITLEDEVAVSPRAMLFTHSYWQSVLEGYEAQVGPIHVARKAWIGASATVLPGSTIGEGAIVMANSCVSGDVGLRTLVAGVPARPIRSELGSALSAEDRDVRLREILTDFVTYLGERGCTVTPERDAGTVWAVEFPDGSTERMVYGASDWDATSVGFGLEEVSGPALDLDALVARGPDTLLKEELRNFLRRYGIRLEPWAWHYDLQRGLGRFER